MNESNFFVLKDEEESRLSFDAVSAGGAPDANVGGILRTCST